MIDYSADTFAAFLGKYFQVLESVYFLINFLVF